MKKFTWRPHFFLSCFEASIELHGYGHYNFLGLSFFFDPHLTLGKYTSKLGAYVSVFHPDDYVDPLDGFFLSPKTTLQVSVEDTGLAQLDDRSTTR